MICDDVIYLITEDPAAHGIFDKPTEKQTMCYCRVNSVSRNEYYKALNNDLRPEYVFVLSEYADYDGQKIILYKNKRYRVIRSYVSEHSVELTVEEATVDGRTD